ncbi:hypothetical protein, partial [Serratia proteamaculans]|uniref:hypothetical protein n=1 Tax=Serratia proteamaculans TaxID=28151 RepID=UPI003D01B8F7
SNWKFSPLAGVWMSGCRYRAEIAEFVTEGDMHIQRQRTLWITRSGALKRRFVIALVELQ